MGDQVGQPQRVSWTFTVTNGGTDYYDPAAITLKTIPRAVGGTVTTYTFGVGAVIVRDSLGHYHANIPTTIDGNWQWRAEGRDGGGNLLSSQDAEFYLEPRPFLTMPA